MEDLLEMAKKWGVFKDIEDAATQDFLNYLGMPEIVHPVVK